MTNAEKYLDTIEKIINENESLAIKKETLEPCRCIDLLCDHCLYKECNAKELLNWLFDEYVNPKIMPFKDFEEGERVLVRDYDTDDWKKAYFYGIEEQSNGKLVFKVSFCRHSDWVAFHMSEKEFEHFFVSHYFQMKKYE